MKKLSLIAMVAIAALSFQACNNGTKTGSTADSTGVVTDTADSANKVKDSTTTGATGIAVDKDDAKFATSAANAGLAEVALGQLASEKATNAKVKSFGAMMVTDHTKANNELIEIAKKKNISLPTEPDAEHQQKKTDLAAKTGADFDKAYVDAMVDGHKKVASMFEDAAKNCKDADLKAFAEKTLPTIKSHLAEIEGIQKGLK
jgi:putative membrane protein